MSELPSVVVDLIHRLTVAPRSPAYLLVDHTGRVVDCGGELEAYGLAGLEKGDPAAGRAHWLAGLLPLEEPGCNLPCLETDSGCPADLHIVRGGDGDWVLLLDATARQHQQWGVQQAANNLALLREKLSRALRGELAEASPGEVLRDVADIKEGGERREAAVVAIELRGFHTFSDGDDASTVFRTYDRCLRVLAGVIRDGGGILGAISGGSVVAYFGLLPSRVDPSAKAVDVAMGSLEAVEEIRQSPVRARLAAPRAGVGVASGEIAVGLVGDALHKRLNAIGLPVILAHELGRVAEPGEVLVEKDTYSAIGERRRRFRLRPGPPVNIDRDVSIYSYRVEG